MSQVKIIVDSVKKAAGGREISPETLLPVVVAAMEIVEKLSLSGAEKKQLVIEVCEVIVDESITNPDVANFIKKSIPTTVDIAVALTKGKFDINAVKSCLRFGCF